MRIAQVIKAKKLTPGVRVLVFNADGEPAWNRVVEINQQYEADWWGVELEGFNEMIDIQGKTRVVVWK